ncbi:MAG: maleylpyruvate isomerase family mycothiol-dependent enzyme [Actinomycetota bacterium]
MATRTMNDFIAAHKTLYAAYDSWCAGFSIDDLAVASLCPAWDVRDVVAHTIGVESVLDGWEPSTESPPPFDKMGDFAAVLAGIEPDGVARHVGAVTSSRLAHLRSMDMGAADAPSITPTGVKTYGDFLRIRVFDMWVHAHDVALPLGLPFDDGGVAAEIALDEVVGALGYIVGRKVGLPDGMSLVVHVTGEVDRDVAVIVEGKARVVDEVATPDVELTADVETFVLLAAGRVDPQRRIDGGRIAWTGDAEWGERVARTLVYTM